MANQPTNIQKYKRKREFNIGIFLFSIIFIYIFITVVLYFTRNQVVAFEVRQGRIRDDRTFNGLILREEAIFPSESNGFLYYFQAPLSKTKSNAPLFAITANSLNLEALNNTEDLSSIHNESHPGFLHRTQNFLENFDPMHFGSVDTLRADLETSFHANRSGHSQAAMDAVIEQTGGNAQVINAPRDGILSFWVDGFEGLTLQDITKSLFEEHENNQTLLENGRQVSAGDPAIKLITGESWQIVIPVENEMANRLEQMTWIRLRFLLDGSYAWAIPHRIERDGQDFIALQMNQSMIRFADQRFINIELILEDQTGLMIPRSAVTSMGLLIVPADFIATSETGNLPGIMVLDEQFGQTFQAVRIYQESPEGEILINPNEIPSGTRIIRPGSSETLTLRERREVQGVFQINHGYAIFRQIQVLSQNDDYFIIIEGDRFGLSNFDLIAQDGEAIFDGEIVAR